MHFSDWLLQVGEGRVPTASNFGDDVIRLPQNMILPGDNVMDLIHEIYGQDPTLFSSADFLRGRAILTTTNKMVDDINDKVLHLFPGEVNAISTSSSLQLTKCINSLLIDRLLHRPHLFCFL